MRRDNYVRNGHCTDQLRAVSAWYINDYNLVLVAKNFQSVHKISSSLYDMNKWRVLLLLPY